MFYFLLLFKYSWQWPEGRGEGISGAKGKGFAGTIIKDTWTITRGCGNRGGRWGGLGCWAGVGGKSGKLYLNNNKKIKQNIILSRKLKLKPKCAAKYPIFPHETLKKKKRDKAWAHSLQKAFLDCYARRREVSSQLSIHVFPWYELGAHSWVLYLCFWIPI